ncbi:hypothetical protein DOTSEDRAFT_82609 [Dothistroma septosporum NZE10]|uniref:Uncharacterized protein n=1 Tax=Dothistroma septosporum (strain NZE10 / CBS 128990) TaxID=675120 RepID=N1PC84_DOTSN|nr:hypothetical protein DOTSEDRAFT_82609 [Dothistroma septosporum NZE10]
MAKDKAAKSSSTKQKDASAKKARPTKPTKSTSKSSGLSEERIADSDSEHEVAPTPKKVSQKASKESVPRSTSKKESTKKVKALSPPSSSEDSTSAEEMTKIVPKKPDGVPAKVNGVKRKAEEKESSEEESSGADSEEETQKRQAKKAKTTPSKATSSSSSDVEESSEESEADKPAAATNTDTAKNTQPAATQLQQSSLRSISAKPFEPPTGYSSLSIDAPASDSLLSKKSLAGKQIWHITAPSNIPIKEITHVALDAISNVTPVLNYKDVDYVLNEDKSYNTQYSNVLLPGEAGYQHVGQSIERTLRLQQKIELPNLSKKQADLNTGSNAAADIAQPPASEIRPQPKGLKMRYKPPGFGKGNPAMFGSSDDEAEQSTSGGFQFPKALGAHGAADEPETAIAEKSKKRDKKKKRKSEDLIDGDVEIVNGELTPLSSKKKKKKQEEELERVISKESERSQEQHDETPGERARRKEQKRLRKEAKKRAKEGESGVEKAF